MIQLFLIIILVLSAVIHEYLHGWMAYRLGDPTAKNAGRLTLNPLKHLEWFGSVILPLVMVISQMPFLFAWAKPVPYNPYNLRDKKYGEAKVAVAGAVGNLIIAITFGLLIRFFPGHNLAFQGFIGLIVFINLILAVFNLMPIPPLDGSKVLATFLPAKLRVKYLSLERFGFLPVILFIMLAGHLMIPIVNWLFILIVGFN
ncbi:MAG: site-2 protease family protein [Patescibacteria group bacterium]|jgi:Zn-dependent protease